ncbi:MAG: leucine-rich repeat domain-containing protein [Treponema sp.]|nr:leucine-rich repeat domain-containing protein [Treponema sp.]
MKIRNYLFLLGLAFLITSCNMNAKSLQEPSVSTTPSVKAGDIFALSYYTDAGANAYDYYCFTSDTEGVIISNPYASKAFDLSTVKFDYDDGQSSINGNDWLTFFYENNCVRAFNKKNAYVRESGKDGLYATFTNGGIEIKFAANGKASVKDSSSEIACKYTNENGRIYLTDSYKTYTLYYFSDGYVVFQNATSVFTTPEKITLHLVLDDPDASASFSLPSFFKNSLPDGFTYLIYNLNKAKAKMSTVKELLRTNPNKNFYFGSPSSDSLFSEYEVPDNYFEGYENLYGINFGNVYTPVKIGNAAFKNCTNLETIDASLKCFWYFGESAFEGCSSLKAIEISGYHSDYYGGVSGNDEYMVIGKNAFKGCSNLYAIVASYKDWYVTQDDISGTVENKKSIKNEVNDSSISDAAERNKANAKLLTETYVDYTWFGIN